jgi:D-ribose pyranase
MKKNGILHPGISEVVASMGHTDMLVIADAGLPIPDHVVRIDLALAEGIPPFLKTVQVILGELKVQEAIIAEEMVKRSPTVFEQLREVLAGIPITQVPHESFKEQTWDAKVIVRTGEFTPYANVILVSGVVF